MLLFTIVIILTVTNIIGLNLSIDFTGGTLYEVENINSQALDAISEFSSDLELSVTRYESINDGDYYRFRTVEGSIEDENIVLNQISTFFGTPKSEIPSYITSNLKYSFFDWQEEAFQYLLLKCVAQNVHSYKRDYLAHWLDVIRSTKDLNCHNEILILL